MDRRIYINERVSTASLRQTSHNLTFYGIEAINRYRKRVEQYNPTLEPLPEPVCMRIALDKHGLPSEFRKEWMGAD